MARAAPAFFSVNDAARRAPTSSQQGNCINRGNDITRVEERRQQEEKKTFIVITTHLRRARRKKTRADQNRFLFSRARARFSKYLRGRRKGKRATGPITTLGSSRGALKTRVEVCFCLAGASLLAVVLVVVVRTDSHALGASGAAVDRVKLAAPQRLFAVLD